MQRKTQSLSLFYELQAFEVGLRVQSIAGGAAGSRRDESDGFVEPHGLPRHPSRLRKSSNGEAFVWHGDLSEPHAGDGSGQPHTQ